MAIKQECKDKLHVLIYERAYEIEKIPPLL